MTDANPLAGIVNPLEWREHATDLISDRSEYVVYHYRVGKSHYRAVHQTVSGPTGYLAEGVSREKAVEICNAHNTARILAALDTDKIAALVEAATEYTAAVDAFDGRIARFSEKIETVNAARLRLNATLAAMKGQPHE